MKRLLLYRIYLCFFLGLFLFGLGCKRELLNTIPNDRISSVIFWNNEDDAIRASNAIYAFLIGNSPRDYFLWDGISDIGHNRSPESAESQIERGSFDGLSSRVEFEWDHSYAAIRAVNDFLIQINRVDFQSPNLKSRLEAEAKFIRAFFYIRLAFLFGDVPLVLEPLNLEESRTVTQSNSDQIIEFIKKELTDIASDLPLEQEEHGRVTKGAAIALKARAMLFFEKYEEAANAAKEVMDLREYSIYPSYKNLFSYEAEGNKEVLFDLQFSKDVYPNDIFHLLAPLSQNNAASFYVPTKKVLDAYLMKNGKEISDPSSGFDPSSPYANRDPRLKYTMFVPGSELPDGSVFNPIPGEGSVDEAGATFIVSPTGLNIKKYVNDRDLGDPANCGINLIVIRYAEVLLTYAEAKIELNQIDGTVTDAIDQIRTRGDVDMPQISNSHSQEELRDIVRHERLVELAFEGLRFFDIRRWHIMEEAMTGKVKGITYPDQNGELKTIEVPGWTNIYNERNYLWPLPQKELDLNSMLKQNSGW